MVSRATGASSSLKPRLSWCPARQSCSTHRNTNMDQIFDWAQSCSVLCGQLSTVCDRTMIYLHALEILGPEMRECREKDAWKKQKGLLPLLGSSDVCSSLIHLPRRDVHEDRRQPWLTGAKEDFSVTLVQNEESVDTSSAIPFLLALTPLHLCCSFPPRWELQSRQKNH